MAYIELSDTYRLDILGEDGVRILSIEDAQELVGKMEEEAEGRVLKLRMVSGGQIAPVISLLQHYESFLREVVAWRNITDMVKELPEPELSKLMAKIGNPDQGNAPDMREFNNIVREALLEWLGK